MNKKHTHIVKTADSVSVSYGDTVYITMPYSIHIKIGTIKTTSNKFKETGLFIESSSFLSFDGKEIKEFLIKAWISEKMVYFSKRKAAEKCLDNMKSIRSHNKKEIEEFEKSIEEGKFND